MKTSAMDIVINTVLALSVVVVLITGYAAWKESEIKEIFDETCRSAGGIPLRATYHYDPKENKMHYVCLRQTSVMDVE